MSRITFLGSGTSGGVPTIGCSCEVCTSQDRRDNRLRSSVLIEHEGKNIVIDTSMDFRYQMLRAGLLRIDAVLCTHAHKDHIGGLDDIRAFNYLMGRDVDIYAEEGVIEVLKKDFDYAFNQMRYPGVPMLELHQITNKPFVAAGVDVIPIRGMHHKLPVLGYRIGDICYITDMNYISDSEIEKFKGVKLLVINALRHEEHISHFNLQQALEVVEKATPQKTYLTHISHQLGLYSKVNPTLPLGVELAYDTLSIEI